MKVVLFDIDGTLLWTDGAGKAVYSGAGSRDAGKHSFAWDGKGIGGVQLPDGPYTVSVGAVADKTQIQTSIGVVG